MEDVLDVYARLHSEEARVICLDEEAGSLIYDTRPRMLPRAPEEVTL